MDTYWIDFENAATYAHARTLVEVEYRSKNKSEMSTQALIFHLHSAMNIAIDRFQAQVDALNHENEQIRSDLSEMKAQTSKVCYSSDSYFVLNYHYLVQLISGMDWVMKAMAGGIMDTKPPPMFEDSKETNV